MANEVNLKPFPKGVSGNPRGMLRLPAEIRQARRENMEGLIKLIHQYVAMTREEAQQRLAGNEALQLEAMVQGQIDRACLGDAPTFRFLIEVMCGKIPETDETLTADTLTPEQKLELMEKATASLRAQIGSSTPRTGD